MAVKRDEMVQSLIEKMSSLIKSMHTKHGFPFGEFQLSRPQIMIMMFISKNKEEVSTKDLAKFLNVTSGAITQFIDPLAEKNLINREQDANDRRIIRITLTQSAAKRFTSFKNDYYKSVTPAFSSLDEKDIRQMILLLNKINVGQ
jgi:DNA-binding MarR family transcriptional regulator